MLNNFFIQQVVWDALLLAFFTSWLNWHCSYKANSCRFFAVYYLLSTEGLLCVVVLCQLTKLANCVFSAYNLPLKIAIHLQIWSLITNRYGMREIKSATLLVTNVEPLSLRYPVLRRICVKSWWSVSYRNHGDNALGTTYLPTVSHTLSFQICGG